MSATSAPPTTEPRPLLVAGVATDGSDRQPVVYPHDGSEIGSVWLASDEIVERALAAATAAEPEVAALRLRKDAMDPAEYEKQSEKLLTELALKTRAIRERENKK